MRLSPLAFAPFCLALLAGCGGGGGSPALTGGSTGTTGGTGGGTSFKATAHFDVNVKTGKVTITPGSTAPKSKVNGKVFTGTSVLFNSSVLLDQPGDTGRKVLQVSLTNRSGETIGQMPDGTQVPVDVILGPITNGSASNDRRASTTVSTLAGGTAGTADGAASSAQFKSPTGVTVSTDGTVYVADKNNNEIRSISGGRVSTIAGNPSAGAADGVGHAASFSSPMGVAFNPFDGSLIVAEVLGNRIRRVTTDGRVTTIAGNGSVGGANGTGAAATFSGPTSVVVSPGGAIYVSEDANRIRKIVLTSTSLDPRLASSYTVTTYAGTGTAGAADGPNASATFNLPRGLALDNTNTLYVADYGNRKIRRISTSGEVVTIAGTGANASTDGLGNAAAFKSPNGLTWINGALFVGEYGGALVRQVQLLPGGSSSSAASWQVSTIAGTGAPAFTNGTGDVAAFNGPFGIAADPSGNLDVADLGNNAIRRVIPSNTSFPIGVSSGGGSSEPVEVASPDGNVPITGEPILSYREILEQSQTTDPKDWVFIVPAGVTAFSFDVTVETATPLFTSLDAVTNAGPTGAGSKNNIVRPYAGGLLSGFVDGTRNDARFHAITHAYMGIDSEGDIFVPDGSNHAVRRVGRDGVVSTVAGATRVGGSSDGLGDVATFGAPSAVAVSADGTLLFVVDFQNHNVRRLQLQGGDPHMPASWSVTTVAGTGTPGKDDGPGGTASFNEPTGIAMTEGGVLYVTEQLGNRVRRVVATGADPTLASNWVVSTVAGDNSAVAGASGSTDGFDTSARFFRPTGIAVDRNNNLFVADSLNDTIRKIDPTGNVTTVAGQAGTAGYTDGSLGVNKLSAVGGLALDHGSYLYIADGPRIRRLSPGGLVTTVVGSPASGEVNGTGDLATFPFVLSGIAFNAAGDLYGLCGASYTSGGGSTFSVGSQIKVVQRIQNSGTSTKRTPLKQK